MFNPNQFKIDLKTISATNTQFEYNVDSEFFREVIKGEGGLTDVAATVVIDVEKSGAEFHMEVHVSGHVVTECDRCLDPVELPISCEEFIVVRYGDNDEDDGDEIIVEERRGTLDVIPLIKDYIFLSVPFRHVHAPGKCNPAMLEILEKYDNDARSDEDDEEEENIDPRYSALKELKKHFKD